MCALMSLVTERSPATILFINKSMKKGEDFSSALSRQKDNSNSNSQKFHKMVIYFSTWFRCRYTKCQSFGFPPSQSAVIDQSWCCVPSEMFSYCLNTETEVQMWAYHCQSHTRMQSPPRCSVSLNLPIYLCSIGQQPGGSVLWSRQVQLCISLCYWKDKGPDPLTCIPNGTPFPT